MNFESLLNELKERQIELGLVEGKLKVLDPLGRLDTLLVDHIKKHKNAILAVLAGQPALSPTDFPLARLTSSSLKTVSQQFNDIEDIYLATPMQAGMLFHGQEDSGASYTNINFCVLDGLIDVGHFEKAWQQLVQDIAAFRTQFVYTEDGLFHQVITSSSSFAVIFLDWRSKSSGQQTTDLSALMQAERQHGFDFCRAPLMRMHLVQTQEQQYYFIWAQHHAIADGWSRPLIFNAFIKHYHALRHNLRLPTFAFSRYQNYLGWLQTQDQHVAAQYWRTYLAGFQQRNSLHIDTLPVSRHSSGYADEHLILNRRLSEQLTALSRREARTMNSLFQAAWALLLQRYSGEDDVVFGSTVSGRPAAVPGIERMVGMFLNTLPVRVRLMPDSTVRQLVEQTHTAFLDANNHAFLGLSDIQRCASLSAGESLFDSLLVYQNFPDALQSTAVLGETGFTVQKSGSVEHTSYALLFNIFDTESLAIRVTFSLSRFAAATVQRMLQHLEGILQCFADSGLDLKAADIKLNGQRTGRQTKVSQQPGVPELYRRLDSLFEAQARASPESLACICGAIKLTYRQLNERSNQLAHALIARGIKVGTVVGIGIARSADMMVALLAVMKVGGIYVPFDQKLPLARIQFMVQDAATSLILCHQEQQGLYQQCGVTTLAVDAEWFQAECRQYAKENPEERQTAPSDLLYILYTSGSSGQPKGVLVEHQSVCNYLTQLHNSLGDAQFRGALVSSPLLFDGTVSTLYLPFLRGLYVELLDSDETDLTLLADYLMDDEDSLLFKITPSHLAALQHYCPRPQIRARHLIMVAGEQLPASLATEWKYHLLPECRFFNEYGPTEISVAATIYELGTTEETALTYANIPIGKAFDSYSLYVLDTQCREVPAGIPGELYIGGQGVARGYLNRPELTEERFVQLEFAGQAPQRVYRTGDRVRRLENGQLEFLERMDFQVKLRGVRIEPGEIEYLITSHPAVSHAQVLLGHHQGLSQLVAFIVTDASFPDDPDGLPLIDQVRLQLQRHLPDAMVPAEFVVLDELPLSPSGKVDRQQLLERFHCNSSAEFVAASTELEQQLVMIWRTVLPKASFCITDNFFRIGGHSLLVMKVLSEIKRQLGYVVTVTEFFHFPTIRTMANFLQRSHLNEQLDTVDVSMIEQGEF